MHPHAPHRGALDTLSERLDTFPFRLRPVHHPEPRRINPSSNPSPGPYLPLPASHPKAGLFAYCTYSSWFGPCLKHYIPHISKPPQPKGLRKATHPPQIAHRLVQRRAKHVADIAEQTLARLEPKLLAQSGDEHVEPVRRREHEYAAFGQRGGPRDGDNFYPDYLSSACVSSSCGTCEQMDWYK